MSPEHRLPTEPDQPPDDSDRNDPEYELAKEILEAAGWDPNAIAGRLEHHRRKGTLVALLERLPSIQEAVARSKPEARAKIDALELELEL